ncbi:AAA family ATPase [Nonomuraea sp. NPDC050783]|uniref:AAA family ATPase n=1 Tax=Nonomuraea sp. NPDC050783 TaxID=3154634 RepID=UPI0034674789
MSIDTYPDFASLSEEEFQPMSLIEASRMADTEEDFMIDGLITTGTTLLYGEPNAGKSLMTAGMLASLVTGEPFLGRRVNAASKVAVCWSDDRAYAEYGKRIMRVLHEDYWSDVRFYRMPIMRTADQWGRLYERVIDDGCDFAVFDVLPQIIDGDINDGPPVAQFFDGVRRFTRDGVPALVLTHSSEKRGQNGYVTDKPLGHTSISGYARWNVFLRRSQGGEWTARASGKWGEPFQVKFRASQFDVPRFEVTAEKTADEMREDSQRRRRNHNQEALDRNLTYARFIVENCQGRSQNKAAEDLAAEFGGKVNRFRNLLTRGRLPVRRIGDRWELTETAA